MQTFVILVCAQNNSSGENQNFHVNQQPKK